MNESNNVFSNQGNIDNQSNNIKQDNFSNNVQNSNDNFVFPFIDAKGSLQSTIDTNNVSNSNINETFIKSSHFGNNTVNTLPNANNEPTVFDTTSQMNPNNNKTLAMDALANKENETDEIFVLTSASLFSGNESPLINTNNAGNEINNSQNQQQSAMQSNPATSFEPVKPVGNNPINPFNNSNVAPVFQTDISNQALNQNQNVQLNQPLNINPTSIAIEKDNNQTNEKDENISNSVSNQNSANSKNTNIEIELLETFVGKKYFKLKTRPFNFAAMFFSFLYIFYRKMIIGGLLVYLLSLIIIDFVNINIVTTLYCVLIGLCFNHFYISSAQRRVAKIKVKDSNKSYEEVKKKCKKKGGTSIISLIGGLLLVSIVTIVYSVGITFFKVPTQFSAILLSYDLNSVISNIIKPNEGGIYLDKTTSLEEDVNVDDYTCVNNDCNVSIVDINGNITEYKLNVDNKNVFFILNKYTDYVKLNIYYTQKGNDKYITDYKIYARENLDDISSVSTEDELREKIGLYPTGTYTDTFTLIGIGSDGVGFNDDASYTYKTFIFRNSKNAEYEMKYINYDGSDLTEQTNYNITFEVKVNSYNYEYYIQAIN